MMAPASEPAPRRRTILVVEDNVELRFLVSDVLRAEGFRVIEAASVDEAVAYLRTPNEVVALVFSDIVMPGNMDGIDFARLLEREYPHIRIILTSGKVPPEKVPANILLIKKPYILARVVTEVKQALGPEPKE